MPKKVQPLADDFLKVHSLKVKANNSQDRYTLLHYGLTANSK